MSKKLPDSEILSRTRQGVIATSYQARRLAALVDENAEAALKAFLAGNWPGVCHTGLYDQWGRVPPEEEATSVAAFWNWWRTTKRNDDADTSTAEL